MKKKAKSVWDTSLSPEERTLQEVTRHYIMWTEDNEIRLNRKYGWNDVTDAYWGKLPSDWPYNARTIDPRIRTSLLEKNARLLNSKLRGRLVPREGGDVIKARINNAILDYQWDTANDGGSMLEKLSVTDMDSRLYSSKFALVPWKYECDDEGNVIFNGNEFKPLDIRDCGMDPTCDHIRNAKWFQSRVWRKIDDYEHMNDLSASEKEPMYKNLDKLKEMLKSGKSDRRDNAYQDRVLTLKGLTDRYGDDQSYPIIEEVTEYRKDRWITFAPRYKIILRDIPNPYAHKKIPIVQLRYYPIQGDPLGESEVEPVIPLWREIQAIRCGFLDSMNIHMRPPLKVIMDQVRIETIVFGPEAIWQVNRADAITEHQSSGDPMRFYQTALQSALSAFNTAMGDTSMGVSAVDPSDTKRTATEIKKSSQQQLTRDQKNQTSLSEFIQDMMSMWMSNNRQFLFADPTKKEHILRIVGNDLFSYFERAGLHEMETSLEGVQAIGDAIVEQGGNVSDDDINSLIQAGEMPKYPVIENPQEKDPSKLIVKPKMSINEMRDGAELTVVPEDLDGTYDYIPDVKSMAAGAQNELLEARQQAIETLQNPQVLQLLAGQQIQPNMKEVLISQFEDAGLKDAERLFVPMQQVQPQLDSQAAMNMQLPVNSMNGQPIPSEGAAQGGNGFSQYPQVPGLPGAPPSVPQTAVA